MTEEEKDILENKLNEHVGSYWGSLHTKNFEQIGDEMFGDKTLFFAAAEAFYLACQTDVEVKAIMSIFSGLLNVAYQRGRESVTQ